MNEYGDDMNNYEEIYSIIDCINEKLKSIDKELLKVEEIKPTFVQMDTYMDVLESAFKESDELFSNSITRVNTLNKIITDELLSEYENIFQELNSKCSDIINDLLESIGVVESPVEVLDFTPAVSSTENEIKVTDNFVSGSLINQEFIDSQVSRIKIIDKIDNPRDVIPLPTPVEPEIEVLEM